MSTEHEPVLCPETVAILIGSGLEGVADDDIAGGSVVDDSVDDEGLAHVVRQGIYVDATFGRGGHTARLLARLGVQSRVVTVDRDLDAVAAARKMAETEPRLTVCHGRFSELTKLLNDIGIAQVQGVLMDLGVSSVQLNDPQRGFSFRKSGPLDMRMDRSASLTAAEWLNTASVGEITTVLRDYGEERHARRIAAAIVQARPLSDTLELAQIVGDAQPRSTPGKHDATRVFQAVRMRVNDEMTELELGLEQAFATLSVGGRLAVISFHSLEDRTVKRFFRSLTRPAQLPRRVPVRAADAPAPARSVVGRVKAGVAEVARNPRARSALLRVVERVLERAA
ncbi:MAG: 16S rRNA (cytosine(1402)-N(4))-methyltransferase RsmH [Gammaproteobacteria bacterium]|nr:16S rRNA (cytosine(1402)-N(4))-methyltransferase RsmH [Gammaproteobacteria bacterium]